jgi:pachytene checkpoint protein 2
MLSKYFGESGKLIGATFERIFEAAQDESTLVCVVMDEVETIAGSRERAMSGSECADGMRATNQLLTALDRCVQHAMSSPVHVG